MTKRLPSEPRPCKNAPTCKQLVIGRPNKLYCDPCIRKSRNRPAVARDDWGKSLGHPYRRYLKDYCEAHLGACNGGPYERPQLTGHHLNGDHSDNRRENISTVCHNCHILITLEERMRKARGLPRLGSNYSRFYLDRQYPKPPKPNPYAERDRLNKIERESLDEDDTDHDYTEPLIGGRYEPDSNDAKRYLRQQECGGGWGPTTKIGKRREAQRQSGRHR